ncbi:alpha-ribazole phosphatase [Sinomonas atrocyanea]|nr:alpha-ribazole phosphatase [Sinomonas atrocyanea]
MVRHAPTASNASKTYMGSTDVPATAEGIHQAQELGLRLEGHVFDCAYSSPLARAQETLLAIRPQCEIVLDPRLMERSLGAWEGMSRARVQEDFPQAFSPSGAFDPEFAPPGGETFEDFCTRISEFLSDVQRRPVKSALIVTHNGWIRTARYLLGQISKTDIFEEDEPHLQPMLLEEARRFGHLTV